MIAIGLAPEAAMFLAASHTACIPPLIGSDFTYLGVQSVVMAIPFPRLLVLSVPCIFTIAASLLLFEEIVSPITELSYCSQIHLLLAMLGFLNILVKISLIVSFILSSLGLMIFLFWIIL